MGSLVWPGGITVGFFFQTKKNRLYITAPNGNNAEYHVKRASTPTRLAVGFELKHALRV